MDVDCDLEVLHALADDMSRLWGNYALATSEKGQEERANDTHKSVAARWCSQMVSGL